MWKINSILSSAQIKANMEKMRLIDISSRSVRGRLVDKASFDHRPTRKTLVSTKNV